MSRTASPTPSSFPQWVALCSLGLGVWLYFGNTVPAMHDRDALQALEVDLGTLRQQYDAAIGLARLGHGGTADFDSQALFVAIDKKGYTPAEFCAAYPSSAAGDGGPDGDQARAKFR